MVYLFHTGLVLIIYGSTTFVSSQKSNEEISSLSSALSSGSIASSGSKSDASSKLNEAKKRRYRTVNMEESNKEVATQQNGENLSNVGHIAEIKEISNKCVKCICEATGGCKPDHTNFLTDFTEIATEQSGIGPLRITRPYWEDAGSPKAFNKDSSSFLDCANDISCATKTVKAYMERYPIDCNLDGVVNCTDYAAIHFKGPFACRNSLPPSYEERFQNCWLGLSKTPEAGETESWFSRFWKRALRGTAPPIVYSTVYADAGSQIPVTVETIMNNQTEMTSEAGQPETNGFITGYDQNTLAYTEEPTTDSSQVPNYDTRTYSYISTTEKLNTELVITTQETNSFDKSINTEIHGENIFTTPEYIASTLNNDQQTEATPQTQQTLKQTSQNLPNNYWQKEPISSSNELYQSTTVPYMNTEFKTEYISITNTPEINQAQYNGPLLTEQYPVETLVTQNNVVSQRDSVMNYNPILSQASRKINVPLRILEITDECIHCICEATSDCTMKSPENSSFGPFRITKKYWEDAGSPTLSEYKGNSSFISCTTDLDCSERTVKAYMKKFQFDCNGDGIVNCSDYVAIHNNGPYSCREPLPEDYFSRYLKCSEYINDDIPEVVYNDNKTNTDIPVPKDGMLKKWFSNIVGSLST